MNDRDSEALSGLLQDRGFALTDDIKKAEIILLNTCSVRQHAEDKVWSEIGSLVKRRTKYQKIVLRPSERERAGVHRPSEHAKPLIGIIGCMAQNYKEGIFKRCPQVDLVVGPNDLTSIPGLLAALTKERARALAVGAMERERNLYVSNFRQDKNHALVVISEGCNNFCSFCVVPFVRGRLRSRSSEEILEEIKRTIKSGIKQITLLGQNVNSYRDSDRKIDFVRLIELISQIDGLESFDFVTSHPKDTGVKLFRSMAKLKRIKKSLHLPVQSGSNRILKLMNRGYTRQHYLKLAKEYKKIVGGKLSSDIIVGFPTETEKDFQDTLDLVKKVRFDAAYIFKYSPRPQTKASNLNDDVMLEEKKRRHKLCLDLQRKISGEKKCLKKS
ncbi:MAG: MiaB/RimO family radical SAM methylthiotransferase [Candidatus Omnitrophota bacterium]|nr:MiaB/RimO family radical SAM methylthiotransferase [Candidatus Omnitrophota bacterium]